MTGTITWRFRPDYGWQVFDVSQRVADRPWLVIHDGNEKPSLLRISGSFNTKPRRGVFTKHPYRLINLKPEVTQ